MDREEARCVLVEKLAEHRRRPYKDLARQIGNDEYLVVTGPSGTEHQIEIQFTWDDQPGGALRVLAAIDDGSFWCAFRPVCQDFLAVPDD